MMEYIYNENNGDLVEHVYDKLNLNNQYIKGLFEISENFKIVIMRDRRGEEYVNVVIYYLFFCGFWKTVDVWY